MSILVNGSPTEEFRLGRGVRQGDPLSPFLFVLAAEGLNAIVNEAVDKGIFRGVRIGSNRVMVSHLQYADDTIFFGVTDRDNNAMARWMKCGVGGFPFTYLGLPIGENMRRVGAWNPVIDKFKKRKELEGIGIEFPLSFKGVVGNGKEIGFWLDRWAGEGKLCDRFPRLYHLDSSKEGRVADKGRWVDSEWRDQWRWTLREDGVFTVKDLTKIVEEISLRTENGGQETL
ncbi:transposon TX1 [Tanacetum coccineum]